MISNFILIISLFMVYSGSRKIDFYSYFTALFCSTAFYYMFGNTFNVVLNILLFSFLMLFLLLRYNIEERKILLKNTIELNKIKKDIEKELKDDSLVKLDNEYSFSLIFYDSPKINYKYEELVSLLKGNRSYDREIIYKINSYINHIKMYQDSGLSKRMEKKAITQEINSINEVLKSYYERY